LFDAHAGALVLFARQWCDAPEDIVQDAFVALARQEDPPERAVSWLFRVVRNGAIAAARQSHRRRSREWRAAGSEAATDESWFAATDDRIDAEHATRLLAELDDELRAVIVARLWGGLTFEEIGRLQGCSQTTAHRRYQAGLARLHARLESQWISTTPALNSTAPPTT
jgi:RNA polymerase sigma-70 factor (ECF subfamily)